jgi:hypothetical protein
MRAGMYPGCAVSLINPLMLAVVQVASASVGVVTRAGLDTVVAQALMLVLARMCQAKIVTV